MSWEALLARFEAAGRRGALVAPKGHGKSTLLAELAGRLARGSDGKKGWTVRRTKLHHRQRRLSPEQEDLLFAGPTDDPGAGRDAGPGPDDLLVVDSIDQLGFLERGRFRRRARAAGGLLVTAHHPLLLPPLGVPVLLRCRTTPALLAELMAELAPALRPEQDLPPRLRPAALHARHRGNLRLAFLELYDHWAGINNP